MKRPLAALLLPFLLATFSWGQTAEDKVPPAVRFARQDARRAAEYAAALQQQAEKAGDSAELEALEAARAAKAALDKLVAEVDAQAKAASDRKAAAEKAIAAAQAALKQAQTALEAEQKKVAAAITQRTDRQQAVDLAKQALATAQQDQKAAQAQVAALEKQEKAEAEQLEAAKQAAAVRSELVAAATALVSTREAALKQAQAAEKAATDARDKAQALVNSKTAELEQAKAQLANVQKQLEELAAKKKQYEALSAKAAELLKEVDGVAKPKAEEKAAAGKKAAAAQQRADALAARAQALAASLPEIAPKNTHEVAKFGFERPFVSCRYDETGRYLFAGAQHQNLLRWDVATRRQAMLPGHQSWIRRFALQPDGSLLVSGDYSGNLAWWNPVSDSPHPLRTAKAHEGYVRGVAISPDGRFVATGGNDGFVRVWDAQSGSLVAELDGHRKEQKVLDLVGKPDEVYVNHVYNVAFDPTGRYLVSGDLVGVLKQWEVGTWKHVRDLDAGVLHKYDKTFRAHVGGIRGMDFSPDGKRLAVCGIGEVTNAFAGVGKPTAAVFDFETGKRVAVLKASSNAKGTCWAVRFHPSGEYLVGTGGHGGGSLWFWKPTEEKSFFDFKLPQVGYDVDFHPDGVRLAVALYDRTLRVYAMTPKPAAEKKDGKK